MNPGFLHLLCGKMASGKSTFATALARSTDGLLLSEDAWLARLFPGEIVDVPTYVRFAGRLKQALQPFLVAVLRKGMVVVLDFPANTVDQRAWLLGVAKEAGVDHTLHYLECTDAQCLARLNMRRLAEPERSGTDTLDMFHAVTRHFQAPDAREGLTIQVEPSHDGSTPTGASESGRPADTRRAR